ncbi:MAG: hypothetical protein J5674_00495 [Candidatus Methanomethylophilaceae archaeon]|nr:hypothetical protein [Candidatus Methanomethylophilaceae archaeon]
MYRDKDCVEKLFSSMKSDIGIRLIRAWTDDGVYGVLLIGFLAQALTAMTRLLAKPADGKATKFISDAVQKLTLTIKRRGLGGTEMILSNFSRLNTAILRAFGVIPEDVRCESANTQGRNEGFRPSIEEPISTVKSGRSQSVRNRNVKLRCLFNYSYQIVLNRDMIITNQGDIP